MPRPPTFVCLLLSSSKTKPSLDPIPLPANPRISSSIPSKPISPSSSLSSISISTHHPNPATRVSERNGIHPKCIFTLSSSHLIFPQITPNTNFHHPNSQKPVSIRPYYHTKEHYPSSQIMKNSNFSCNNGENRVPILPNIPSQEQGQGMKSMTGALPIQTSQFAHQNADFSDDRSYVESEYAAAVEKIYRILRKFHSRSPKLELALQESKVPVSAALVARVLNRCGDAGNLGYRFFVWASKQPGYRNSIAVYKSMIKILGKMRQFGAVWALIDEMRKENPELITADIFVILMRRFASARMVEKAIGVLDEMPKFGCEPDEHVFGCLLDALSKNGSVKEAARLFEDMRFRFPPNLRHFTSLLYGWCKEGKLTEAKFVLIQMKEAGFCPDIVVYNNLLGGYAAAGKMGDAFHLLGDMKKKGCNPNATSYTILIQALCANEKTEEAMRVFVDMGRNGCAADVVTYTTMISGFCKCGKITTAYELLDSMIQNGCHPNQMTYFCLFAAHEKKEQLEECVELIGKMSKAGCAPDLNVYNVVIRLACKLGELEQAMDAWNEIEACRVSPGVDSFVIMVHGLLAQSSLVDACKYFKEMVERGLLSAPQYGTLKELLNSLLRAGKLELAKDVWASIVNKGCQLNVYAWTIWIHALFSNRHVKEACSYCLDMLDSGLMPQPDTFAKLMRGLKKLYNRHIAAEITEKVRQMAADRGVTFKSYKRRGVRLEKDKQNAKKTKKKTRGHRRRWGRASRAEI